MSFLTDPTSSFFEPKVNWRERPSVRTVQEWIAAEDINQIRSALFDIRDEITGSLTSSGATNSIQYKSGTWITGTSKFTYDETNGRVSVSSSTAPGLMISSYSTSTLTIAGTVPASSTLLTIDNRTTIPRPLLYISGVIPKFIQRGLGTIHASSCQAVGGGTQAVTQIGGAFTLTGSITPTFPPHSRVNIRAVYMQQTVSANSITGVRQAYTSYPGYYRDFNPTMIIRITDSGNKSNNVNTPMRFFAGFSPFTASFPTSTLEPSQISQSVAIIKDSTGPSLYLICSSGSVISQFDLSATLADIPYSFEIGISYNSSTIKVYWTSISTEATATDRYYEFHTPNVPDYSTPMLYFQNPPSGGGTGSFWYFHSMYGETDY